MISKTKYRYNEDLETYIMMMTDDQFIEWLKHNEVVYDNPNLLEVMIKSKKIDEDNI